jgi:exonuclease III
MARLHSPISINSNPRGKVSENNKISISILYQNICSLHHKTPELEIWLNTLLNQVNVLCLTEQWLNCQNLINTNIQNFKLVSTFNRKYKTHGGSCIYVKDNIVTKDIDCFTTFGEEINFELSLTELVDFKLYVGCIYRVPNGQFAIFLDKLETMIQKLLSKNKILILCGDWNVDMLHESSNQSELLGLLQRHNLVNTIQSPTKITNNSITLLDLMVINKIWYKSPASVHELGLSYHLAQILSVTSSKPIHTPIKSWRRNFNKNNINKFTKLLEQARWQDVNLVSEANAKFDLFISKLIFLFNKAFPLRQVVTRKTYHATWVTQGIKKSSKNVRLLN